MGRATIRPSNELASRIATLATMIGGNVASLSAGFNGVDVASVRVTPKFDKK